MKTQQLPALDIFQDWLDSYLNFEKKPKKNIFWLETMNFLCNRFHHPEQACPCFHVAGSKGKGSVSELISSILEQAGYKCGLYTSPHILNFSERVGFAHRKLTESVYEKSVREIMNGVDSIIPEILPEGRPITWFELVTLFSFLCFRNAQTDFAVYEVGMGGRLDSTNVVTPLASIITPIEFEHSEYLGDTIEKIAGEKAGIIKQGVPVFCSSQIPSVQNVIQKKADAVHTECIFIDNLLKNISYSYSRIHDQHRSRMDICIDSPVFTRPLHAHMKLFGSFQAYNAALAAITVKKILPEIPEDIIETGISNAKLSGRFEIIPAPQDFEGIKEIVFDGAHTFNSISNTMNTIRELYPHENIHLLFACAKDKEIEHIVKLLKNTFQKISLTRPGSQKQCDLNRLEKAFFSEGFDFSLDENYKKAIKKALVTASNNNAVLLVTGSFYLVAETKKILNKK